MHSQPILCSGLRGRGGDQPHPCKWKMRDPVPFTGRHRAVQRIETPHPRRGAQRTLTKPSCSTGQNWKPIWVKVSLPRLCTAHGEAGRTRVTLGNSAPIDIQPWGYPQFSRYNPTCHSWWRVARCAAAQAIRIRADAVRRRWDSRRKRRSHRGGKSYTSPRDSSGARAERVQISQLMSPALYC